MEQPGRRTHGNLDCGLRAADVAHIVWKTEPGVTYIDGSVHKATFCRIFYHRMASFILMITLVKRGVKYSAPLKGD